VRGNTAGRQTFYERALEAGTRLSSQACELFKQRSDLARSWPQGRLHHIYEVGAGTGEDPSQFRNTLPSNCVVFFPRFKDAGRAAMARSHITQPDYSLAGVAIFAGLPREALERIQRRCAWRRYESGEPIVDYLDASDEVFFIASGEVRVTIYSLAGKAVSFSDMGPGEVFGEYPAIDRGPRSASVEARTSCLVASLPAEAFRELLRAEPRVAQVLLPQLVMKIRALTTRVYEFSTLAVKNRIQAELLRLASLAPRDGKRARIAPAPTHTHIASRVSTHREAVTRELNRLSRIGILERAGGTLVVMDIDRLAQMVHDATGE
jgi:CRP/FNR family transcriptional regulator, cyclic AMP receptor protein